VEKDAALINLMCNIVIVSRLAIKLPRKTARNGDRKIISFTLSHYLYSYC